MQRFLQRLGKRSQNAATHESTVLNDDDRMALYLGNTRSRSMISVFVIGGQRSGKSSLVKRYIHGYFIGDRYDPTGDDSNKKQISLASRGVLIEFLGYDLTPSQTIETLQKHTSDYYLILLYHVGRQESLAELKNVYEHLPLTKLCCGKTVIATATDLPPEEHHVHDTEGLAFAEDVGAMFRKTSAASSEGCGTKDLSATVSGMLLRAIPVHPLHTMVSQERYAKYAALSRWLESQKGHPEIKILVLGDHGVGMSSLLRRLTGDDFDEVHAVSDDTVYQIEMHLFGYAATVTFTAENSFASTARTQPQQFYMLLYKIDDRSSFEHMQSNRRQILGGQAASRRWLGGLVVATGMDRVVETQVVQQLEGLNYAWRNDLDFTQTSAKSGQGCSTSDCVVLVRNLLLQVVN